MRTCPKCGKKYDDSWEMCLNCQVRLIGANAQDQKVLDEIAEIRGTVAKLLFRLGTLEEQVKGSSRRTAKRKEPLEGKEPARGNDVQEVEPFKPIKKIREKKKPVGSWKQALMNIEQLIGGRWFNKLGILAVVVGVALLLGYSFKYLGAPGKLAIGYAVSLALLGFGVFLEKKKEFSLYAKPFIGGGWALVYFTTFAMHHLPAVQVIKSPLIGMACLLAVSAAAVAHMQKYRSQAATGFSYLLVFITLLIAPKSMYVLMASLLAACSVVFFMVRFKWGAFGLFGMIMSYATFVYKGTAPVSDKEFLLGLGVLGIYWLVFVVSSLFMEDSAKTREKVFGRTLGQRDIVYTLNFVFVCCIANSMINSGFGRYLLPVLEAGAGLYLLLTIVTFWKEARSLYLISSGCAVFLAVCVLYQLFYGYSLTIALILLAQIILISGIVLNEVVWRKGGTLFLLGILGKLLFADAFLVPMSPWKGGVTTRAAVFVLAAGLYLLSYFFYRQLEKKQELADDERIYPVILSYTFPAIYAMGTWLDLPKVLLAPAWVALGTLLLHIGISLNNKHQRIQGYILSVGAFVRLIMSNLTVTGGIGIFSYRVLTVVPVVFALYYCLVSLRDTARELFSKLDKEMRGAFMFIIFAALMLLIRFELAAGLVALAWAALSLAYLMRGVQGKRPEYLSLAAIAALCAAARAVFVNVLPERYLVWADSETVFPLLTIAVLFCGNLFCLTQRKIIREAENKITGKIMKIFVHAQLFFGLSACALLTTLLAVRLDGVMLTIGLGLEGLLLFLAGFGIKERNWRLYGLFLLMFVLVKTFLIDLRQLSTLYYILCLIALGVALLLVSYIYTKYKDNIKRLVED